MNKIIQLVLQTKSQFALRILTDIKKMATQKSSPKEREIKTKGDKNNN
ncbi:MAG: hypothetical protein IJM09_05250 [Neisseriaceae bacterium]|nr:hypothetical protein [Neisseriaceae bacterium]